MKLIERDTICCWDQVGKVDWGRSRVFLREFKETQYLTILLGVVLGGFELIKNVKTAEGGHVK